MTVAIADALHTDVRLLRPPGEDGYAAIGVSTQAVHRSPKHIIAIGKGPTNVLPNNDGKMAWRRERAAPCGNEKGAISMLLGAV
jgi:hypothetical protein